MTAYETIINQQFERGKRDALELRARAVDMDGTAIIAEERKAPVFDAAKDYSGWAVGSPVRELVNGEYQVYKLLQPYNASHYTGTPATLPALWSLCHTTDPANAKPYVAPNGTSGLYMQGECCTESGHIWRSIVDNNEYSPGDYPDNWEMLDIYS